MSQIKSPVLAAALALCVGVLATQSVHSQEPPAPVRAGFVNLENAFQEYRRVRDIENDAKMQFEAMADSVRAEQAEIEGMIEELQTLNPGTEEWEQKQRTIEIRRFALKRDEEYARKSLLRRTERKHALIYKEICDEAQAYAEEMGLGAVYSHTRLKEGFERNVDLERMMTGRTVLWADESLDITASVVERLNALLPPPSKSSTPPNRIEIEDEPETGGKKGKDGK